MNIEIIGKLLGINPKELVTQAQEGVQMAVRTAEHFNAQFVAMNAKLDAILARLPPPSLPAPETNGDAE